MKDKMEIVLEYPNGEVVTLITSLDFKLLGASISREDSHEYYDPDSVPEYILETMNEVKDDFPNHQRIKFYRIIKGGDNVEITKYMKGGELESKVKILKDEIKLMLPYNGKIVKLVLPISRENGEIEVVDDWYIEDSVPELTDKEAEEFWNFFSKNYLKIIMGH